MSASNPTADRLDDLTLGRARRGDRAAFRVVLEHHHRAVHALVWRMTERAVGSGRVEELVQDVFVRAHGAIARFDPAGPASLSTWLLTIATRVALNELRRPPSGALDAERVSGDGAERPDVALVQRRRRDAVRAALAGLDPRFRAVLILREYHDLSHRDIAAALEIDVGTVKSRLSRGRAAVRAALGEQHE
jgi:RNA polymerase sigma-70 factor (ECF subfamily)